MEKSTEKSVSSIASGNSINSKLRYPLRSAMKSREGKPPVPDFSGSSIPRRGRVASAVSQSTTVLDLSGKKSVDRAKPPRRLSIPTKTPSNSSVKSVRSSITSVSESKAKRSGNVRSLNATPVSSVLRSGYARSLNETPVSSVLRSVTRRKVEDLSSSTYWLTHIKLAESVGKHSISLGFFKLALHAGCEPLDKMKEELKSYASRNSLDRLADAMKELSELYNISEESEQMQITETSSVVAEEANVSLNSDKDVQSSISTPENSNMTSEITKDDALQDSAVTTPVNSNITSEITKDAALQDSTVTETVQEEEVSETIPQERTRRSLDVISVNQEDVSEAVQESEVPNVTVVQPSDNKRANKKETVPKNIQPVKTKKSLATNSAKSRTASVNKDDKAQKKSEKITKPRTKKIQEDTKKTTKKPAAKEGEAKSVKQMKKMENKENSVVVEAGEEIQV